MRRSRSFAIVFAAPILLSACEGTNGLAGMSRTQTYGTAGGTAVGALAGYAISNDALGTVIGAAAGGLIGNRLSNWLEGDATQAAAHAAAKAAESGEKVTWKKTGTTFQTEQEGWASPAGKATKAADGRTCRPVRQSATQAGQTREDTVTLCKTPSGWVPA
jgi:hypothetical protein